MIHNTKYTLYDAKNKKYLTHRMYWWALHEKPTLYNNLSKALNAREQMLTLHSKVVDGNFDNEGFRPHWWKWINNLSTDDIKIIKVRFEVVDT